MSDSELTSDKLQVYLPQALSRQVRRAAKRDGKKLAQVVRESLELYLARSPEEKAVQAFGQLDALVGKLTDDGSGAAERHDERLGSSPRW